MAVRAHNSALETIPQWVSEAKPLVRGQSPLVLDYVLKNTIFCMKIKIYLSATVATVRCTRKSEAVFLYSSTCFELHHKPNPFQPCETNFSVLLHLVVVSWKCRNALPHCTDRLQALMTLQSRRL